MISIINKHIIKTILIIMLFTIIPKAAFIVFASDKREDFLIYNITAQAEAVITGGESEFGELVIPAYIDRYPVIGIDKEAFCNRTDIKKLVVSPKIRYIAENAFVGCANLGTIELNEGLQYIGNNAFSNNHCLKGISIPASVTYIGENAFANCTNLDRINLEQITYANAHIDAYAFEGSAWQNKRDKEMFKIRGSHLIKAQTGKDLIVNIPYGITAIYGCSYITGYGEAVVEQDKTFQEIIFPDTLVDIGDSSFNCVQVEKLYLPPYLTEINKCVFQGSELGEIVFPQKLLTIHNYAFAYASIKSIKFPDNLTTIEKGAFMESCDLTKIVIPASVRCIDRFAFEKCNNLLEVCFKEGLEVIYADAFAYCEKLERIQYPESLKTILYDTYSATLKRIYIPRGTVNIDDKLFFYFCEYGNLITIYGQEGSRAEEVAKAYGMKFVSVNNGNEMP
jgi:hypothetical protein